MPKQFITAAGYFIESEDYYEFVLGPVFINDIPFPPAAPQEYVLAGVGMLNETGLREAMYGSMFVIEQAESGLVEVVPPAPTVTYYPSALLIPGF